MAAGFNNYHSDSDLSVGPIRGIRVHRPPRRYYRSAPLITIMHHPHHNLLLPPSSHVEEENTMIFDDVTTVQELGRFHHYNFLPVSSAVGESTLILDGVAAQERFRHRDHHHHHRRQQRNLVVPPVSSYLQEAAMIFDGEEDGVVQEILFQHNSPPTTNDHQQRLTTNSNNNNAYCLSEEEISKCVELKKNVISHDGDDEGICVICQENLCFESEEEEHGGKKIVGVISSCGHEFHFDCVAKWLQLKNLCPLCKAKPYHTH